MVIYTLVWFHFIRTDHLQYYQFDNYSTFEQCNSERKKARAIRPEIFKEVYVRASLEKCIERDVKGLYAKAISGKIKNFTGLSAPYEEPESPDLVLDTENESIESSINQLEEYIIDQFGKIKK